MKRTFFFLSLVVSFGVTLVATASEPLQLWYRQPATEWVEALPVGNGHIGAMVFGGTTNERIQFNEHTLWTGEPRDYSHPGASNHLAAIRQLLFDGMSERFVNSDAANALLKPVYRKHYRIPDAV